MGRPLRYNHGYPSSTGLPDLIDKPGLRYWYGTKGIPACEKIKKTSQEIGHGVHKAVEKYLKKLPIAKCQVGLDVDQKVMFSSIISWCSRKRLRPLAIEEPLHWYCPIHHLKPHRKNCLQDCPEDCEEFTLAGTPDVVAELGGRKTLAVIDWKTDSVPKSTAQELEKVAKYYWQNCSYAMMYNRKYGTKLNMVYTVRSAPSIKVKPGTQNKQNLILPPYVTVEYSSDYTFAVYKFTDLTQGIEEVKALRTIYRRLKNK